MELRGPLLGRLHAARPADAPALPLARLAEAREWETQVIAGREQALDRVMALADG